MIADGGGRAVAFSLAPGQAHELPMAGALLSRLPETPTWVVADCDCTSHALREHIWSIGARPAISPQRHEAPVACPPWTYHNRNRVPGAAQKTAGCRHTLREDCSILPGCPLPCRLARLAQELTDPNGGWSPPMLRMCLREAWLV